MSMMIIILLWLVTVQIFFASLEKMNGLDLKFDVIRSIIFKLHYCRRVYPWTFKSLSRTDRSLGKTDRGLGLIGRIYGKHIEVWGNQVEV